LLANVRLRQSFENNDKLFSRRNTYTGRPIGTVFQILLRSTAIDENNTRPAAVCVHSVIARHRRNCVNNSRLITSHTQQPSYTMPPFQPVFNSVSRRFNFPTCTIDLYQCESLEAIYSICSQARRSREGSMRVSCPEPRDVWGAPPSLKNIKYTRMRHLKKLKNFLPRGATRECFPGLRCCSRRPRLFSRITAKLYQGNDYYTVFHKKNPFLFFFIIHSKCVINLHKMCISCS